MRAIAVDGVGYAQAWRLLRDANHAAAQRHYDLERDLLASAAMAGDSSFAGEWAHSFDAAAAGAVRAVEDVVTALADLSRLTAASGVNHERAELASRLTRLSTCDPPEPIGPDLYTVGRFAPPSVLGGDPSSFPAWAAVVLDHVEGFVWPDADLERLGAAALRWRDLGADLHHLGDLVRRARTFLVDEQSPEVPLATEALTTFEGIVREVASQCTGLGGACEEYAHQVSVHRGFLLDLVHDLLRDTVLIQTAGILAGLATVGLGTGAAFSANVARISAEAPRFWGVIDALRASTYAASLALEASSTALAEAQLRLVRFTRARLALRNEVGALRYEEFAPRGWLRSHEVRGSHTVRRHVGKSDAWLLARARRDRTVPFASTFTDARTAEQALRTSIRENRTAIERWLDSDVELKRFSATSSTLVGRCVSADGTIITARRIRLLLARDETMPNGFRIVTAFPEP